MELKHTPEPEEDDDDFAGILAKGISKKLEELNQVRDENNQLKAEIAQLRADKARLIEALKQLVVACDFMTQNLKYFPAFREAQQLLSEMGASNGILA